MNTQKTTVKFKNYWEPTPARIRKIGDSALFACTALMPVVMGAPFTDYQKAWINTGLGLLGVAAKVLTNFFKDEPTNPTIESHDQDQ